MEKKYEKKYLKRKKWKAKFSALCLWWAKSRKVFFIYLYISIGCGRIYDTNAVPVDKMFLVRSKKNFSTFVNNYGDKCGWFEIQSKNVTRGHCGTQRFLHNFLTAIQTNRLDAMHFNGTGYSVTFTFTVVSDQFTWQACIWKSCRHCYSYVPKLWAVNCFESIPFLFLLHPSSASNKLNFIAYTFVHMSK